MDTSVQQDDASSPDCCYKPRSFGTPDNVRTAPTSPEVLDDSSLRMFVGCLPFDVDTDDILPIFQNYGTVTNLSIARDEVGNSLCYAFVEYSCREEYEICIMNLHNLFYCGQMPIPMQLRFIEPETITGEYKVFVGGLPPEITPEEINYHFAMIYGPLTDVVLLRKVGISNTAVFLKFLYKSSADQLIEDAAIQSVCLPNGDVCDTIRASYAHSPCIGGTEIDGFAHRGRIVRPPLLNLPTGMEYSPTKLFVGCLPYSKLATDVAEAFELYGPLVEVAVLTDPEGRSKGAAFVTFANKDHAMAAMQGMVGFIFQGSTRPINVSLAHKQNSVPVIQQAVFYQTDVQD